MKARLVDCILETAFTLKHKSGKREQYSDREKNQVHDSNFYGPCGQKPSFKSMYLEVFQSERVQYSPLMQSKTLFIE